MKMNNFEFMNKGENAYIQLLLKREKHVFKSLIIKL